MWEKITGLLLREPAPPTRAGSQTELDEKAVDLAMEVLHGDQDKAKDLAKEIVREAMERLKTRSA